MARPSPRPTIAMVADAPLIERPSEPYTKLAAVDLVVIIPPDFVGNAETRLRLYLSLPGQVAAPILEVAIGTTSRVVIPEVELTDGANDFTATLIGPAGESAALRIERARKLLAETDLAITEVGARVGYSSQSHFTKIFREATGVTPHAFRAATK